MKTDDLVTMLATGSGVVEPGLRWISAMASVGTRYNEIASTVRMARRQAGDQGDRLAFAAPGIPENPDHAISAWAGRGFLANAGLNRFAAFRADPPALAGINGGILAGHRRLV